MLNLLFLLWKDAKDKKAAGHEKLNHKITYMHEQHLFFGENVFANICFKVKKFGD